ncbi:MAG: gluconate 2-dehydrogenase subunit 3 family protein [Gemmatimonadaceae bacterium]
MSDEKIEGVFVKLTSNIKRRDALKAFAATAALATFVDACAAPDNTPSAVASGTSAAGGKGTFPAGKGPRGTPSDPFIIGAKVTWPMLLTPQEMTTLAAMADTIIPADDKSPSATKVGAHNYINEVASAPGRTNDLTLIRGGVMWINGEAMARFNKPFHQLSDVERTAICDDICYVPKAKPGYLAGAVFFDRVRDLTAGAFYTTPEGWKDIGYIGNVPMEKFAGPPVELLQKLGLA